MNLPDRMYCCSRLVAVAIIVSLGMPGPFLVAYAVPFRQMTADQKVQYDGWSAAGLKASSEKRWADAVENFRKCLALAEATWGEGHVRTASSLSAIGVALTDASRAVEGEPLLRRALAIHERQLKSENAAIERDALSVQAGLLNLAINLSRQGRHGDAEPFYRRLLTMVADSFGDDAEPTQGVRIELAGNLCRQNRVEDAESLLRAAAASNRAQPIPGRCADLPS